MASLSIPIPDSIRAECKEMAKKVCDKFGIAYDKFAAETCAMACIAMLEKHKGNKANCLAIACFFSNNSSVRQQIDGSRKKAEKAATIADELLSDLEDLASE